VYNFSSAAAALGMRPKSWEPRQRPVAPFPLPPPPLPPRRPHRRAPHKSGSASAQRPLAKICVGGPWIRSSGNAQGSIHGSRPHPFVRPPAGRPRSQSWPSVWISADISAVLSRVPALDRRPGEWLPRAPAPLPDQCRTLAWLRPAWREKEKEARRRVISSSSNSGPRCGLSGNSAIFSGVPAPTICPRRRPSGPRSAPNPRNLSLRDCGSMMMSGLTRVTKFHEHFEQL